LWLSWPARSLACSTTDGPDGHAICGCGRTAIASWEPAPPNDARSSERPLCPQSPRRPCHTGAVLTNARRYALSLVGIAGEDDLDAGSWRRRQLIPVSIFRRRRSRRLMSNRPVGRQSEGQGDQAPEDRAGHQSIRSATRPIGRRAQRSQSADEAADWVHKNLPAKNTLTSADAETLEASFRERLER
jgi:hypothetical protein